MNYNQYLTVPKDWKRNVLFESFYTGIWSSEMNVKSRVTTASILLLQLLVPFEEGNGDNVFVQFSLEFLQP